MLFIRIFFLVFLTQSCSLFKGSSTLKSQNSEKLLDSIPLSGEGRGRLTINQNQYVFGIESLLKDNHDWILGVSIPFHGEETMIFSDLKRPEGSEMDDGSFEERIRRDFRGLELSNSFTATQLLKEIRSLVRFRLSPLWGQKRSCLSQQKALLCKLDGEEFIVEVEENEIMVIKLLPENRRLHLVGKNLTNSFFTQTDIRLYSNEDFSKKKKSLFSLELFWKN